MKPIIEDYGDGYTYFCPKCKCKMDLIKLPKEYPKIHLCPECGFNWEGDCSGGKNLNSEPV